MPDQLKWDVNELIAIILNRRRLNTLAVGRKAAQTPQTPWTDQGTRGRPMASASRGLAEAKPRP